MDVDTMFAVEDTTQSQTETPESTTETTTQETTPEKIETDLTPNAEQQSILDRIRDASVRAGGYELQNGRVVAKKAEGTPTQTTQQNQTQQTQTQEQSEPLVELNYKGQVVQKPLSEVRNLAQKGFAFEQNSYELNREREELARKAQELDRLLQTMQGFTQQPVATEELSDEDIAQRAMSIVKEKFGKDDPAFEFDPLSPEQTALFNMAVVRIAKANEDQKSQMAAAAQEEQSKALRLANWEQAQKASDPQYDSVIQWIVEPVGVDMTNNPIPRIKQILTAEQYAVADQAFRTGDTATLSKIVTYCKAQYQQQPLGLPTRPKPVAPPVVQAPGSDVSAKAPQKGKAFEWPKNTLTQDERVELIKQRFTRR